MSESPSDRPKPEIEPREKIPPIKASEAIRKIIAGMSPEEKTDWMNNCFRTDNHKVADAMPATLRALCEGVQTGIFNPVVIFAMIKKQEIEEWNRKNEVT